MNGWGKDMNRLEYLRRVAPFSKTAAEQLEVIADYSRKQFEREIEEKWKPKSGTKAVRLQPGTKWLTQKVEFMTTLFDKDYYWMQDVDGSTYLAKVGKDGTPVPLV